MSPMKYRVETFIIPLCNNYANGETKTDDAKLTDLLSKDVESSEGDESVSSLNETIDYRSDYVLKHADDLLSALEESLHDSQNLSVSRNNENVSSTVTRESPDNETNQVQEEEIVSNLHFFGTRHPSIHSIHSLGPIEEVDEKDSDLCYHGCKNGCSATVPTPQEVSQDIFKEHWLRKLEVIKKKETVLKNRECVLQSRERALFMREREVRLLEGNLSDRLKQVEAYLNQIKRPQMIDQQEDTSDLHNNTSTALSNMIPLNTDATVNSEKLGILSNTDINCIPQDPSSLEKIINREIEGRKMSSGSSSSSLDNNGSDGVKMSSQSRSSLRSKGSHSSSSRFSSNVDRKTKKKYKPSFEDLDTTLSADIGDSSFIQTSEKFNPELYKKPFAFRRTVSERRIKNVENKNCDIRMSQSNNIHKLDVWYPTQVEQGKILQRVTKNITATKDRTTKFQHYGLIDQKVETTETLPKMKEDSRDDKKYSYLNLEIGSKSSLRRISQGSKERPTSWNEGTNEWLQKKRQAYNMATKRMQTEDFENKENLKCNIKKEKQSAISKKRDITNKIFTIFR